jgi:NAD(P)-dependent dehydrogenase (short-subunit alcohol dehydrogenase family)
MSTGEVREKPTEFPAQSQSVHPGAEHKLDPEPQYMNPGYKGSGKLKDKVAIITGGDSGIGRSVSILYGREGCKGVVIVYRKNHEDANKTKELVEKEGAKCTVIAGDVSKKEFCNQVVQQCLKEYGQLDILVNHAGVQYVANTLEEITEEHLDETMKCNVYAYFFMAQAALPHMKEGAAIINTTSVNAYKGHTTLIDYTATKGANRAFTYALAQNLATKGIRVNAVAPGPIWTPFIPSSFDEEHVKTFGQNAPMKRAGQPEEVAPAYVFLASNACSSYITGQTIHVNGGYPTDS